MKSRLSWMYRDYATDDEAKMEERKLMSALEGDAPFSDPDFPANGRSLYLNEFQPPPYAIPASLVEWNRISRKEIAGCYEPRTFSSSSSGVVQGALGNRWLIGALGVVSRREHLRAQLVVSSACAGRGLYTVKFYKCGKWRYVHVDDRIPCTRSGTPHYGRSVDPDEVWVMVVEKAYAKLHGCYEAIAVGTLEDGLRDLTGLAVETTSLPSWDEIRDATARRVLLAVCDTSKPLEPLDPAGAFNKPSGLLKNHPYLVAEAIDATADATASYDALDCRMIRLENPWLIGGWTGDWSPGSDLWKTYEPIAKACLPPGDGRISFWIEFRDLSKRFDEMVKTYQLPNKIVRQGAWVPGDDKSGAGGSPAYSQTWKRNPQYCFDVLQSSTVACASISQLDARWHEAHSRAHRPLPLGFVVQSVPGGRRATRFRPTASRVLTPLFLPQRTITRAFALEPGSYVLVPSTYEPAHVATPFVLEIHSDKPITFHDIPEVVAEDDDAPSKIDDPDGDDERDGGSVCAVGSPTPNVHEPPARDLHALWEQAARLATFLASLSDANAAIEEKLNTILPSK
ncbi:hypothetical protein CTAYLR_006499 [Chrysophaeum taylorii]|uniref:Calpain catalytic domain-containing protein n=1 Tax=Chrysophaeum taylorii TaxID=2483200 RepID=A0AAD7ULC3_9STRA|nr:hypothetical protein CTAYLR_006499 [Chrysophaeum taylorii]